MSDDIRGPVISAISGFVGVLVGTALIPWIRGHFLRKRAARYLAIRVVCTLDKYLEDCTDVAEDWGEENREGYSEARVSAPPTPSYPADLDCTASTTRSCMSFFPCRRWLRRQRA